MWLCHFATWAAEAARERPDAPRGARVRSRHALDRAGPGPPRHRHQAARRPHGQAAGLRLPGPGAVERRAGGRAVRGHAARPRPPCLLARPLRDRHLRGRRRARHPRRGGRGGLRPGRLAGRGHRHRALAGRGLRVRVARPGPVRRGRLRAVRPAQAPGQAHVRHGQRRRTGGRPGLGGGDVRRPPRAEATDRPAGRQQLPGGRPRGHDHDDRADRGEMGGVRLGRGGPGRARRRRRDQGPDRGRRAGPARPC